MADAPPPPPPPAPSMGDVESASGAEVEPTSNGTHLARTPSSSTPSRLSIDPLLRSGDGDRGNGAQKRTAGQAFPADAGVQAHQRPLPPPPHQHGVTHGRALAPEWASAAYFKAARSRTQNKGLADDMDEDDAAFRFWEEGASGWITTAAHPFAAPGLPVQSNWSMQARKALEGTPVGYMRFFRLVDLRQRQNVPRKRASRKLGADAEIQDDNKGSGASGPSQSPTVQPSSEPADAEGSVQWREIWRCKACNTEQDSVAGHTENVQKHIRLRKCKRLTDPPFRSGLLQDDDPLVQAVLREPRTVKTNERQEAAKVATKHATSPEMRASASTAPADTTTTPRALRGLGATGLVAARELLLAMHRPFQDTFHPEFKRFVAELNSNIELDDDLDSSLYANVLETEQQIDSVAHAGLNVMRQRQDAIHITLAAIPIKSHSSTLIEPCTDVHVLLWLDHAVDFTKQGRMALGHSTISLRGASPDAKLAQLFEQALAGLSLPATGHLPVTVSSPFLARMLANDSSRLRDVHCDFLPEPMQSITQAAELLLANLGLELFSPVDHIVLAKQSEEPDNEKTPTRNLSHLANAMNTELKWNAALRLTASKMVLPSFLHKTVSIIRAASEAMLVGGPQALAREGSPQQLLNDLASLVGTTKASLQDAAFCDLLRRLAPKELGAFTWKDWTSALAAVADGQSNPFRRSVFTGMLPTLSEMELNDLHALNASLRVMTDSMAMLGASDSEAAAAHSMGDQLVALGKALSTLAGVKQSSSLARATQVAADSLRHDSRMMSKSKAHLLATLLDPAHRLDRLVHLDPTLAEAALYHLLNEVRSRPAAGATNSVALEPTSGDTGTELAVSGRTSDMLDSWASLGGAGLEPALAQLDVPSQQWLTSAGSAIKKTLQEYWADESLPDALRYVAGRYLWTKPNSAVKLLKLAHDEMAHFARNPPARATSRVTGGPLLDQRTLRLACFRLRRSLRDVKLVLDPEPSSQTPAVADEQSEVDDAHGDPRSVHAGH